jgi:hypothetical protein
VLRITVQFETDSAAFADNKNFQVKYILEQTAMKVFEQLQRVPATVCKHPESADLLYDSNGNRVGTVQVEELSDE